MQLRKENEHYQRLSEEREKIYSEIIRLKKNLRDLDHALDEYEEDESGTIKLDAAPAVQQILLPFYNLMKRGAHLKMKRSLFEFLFARNPKIVLSSIIAHAAEEAEKIKSQIRDKELSHFLEIFLREAHKPWNSALYTGKFKILFAEFHALMEKSR